jgi:hypothetical protein
MDSKTVQIDHFTQNCKFEFKNSNLEKFRKPINQKNRTVNQKNRLTSQ